MTFESRVLEIQTQAETGSLAAVPFICLYQPFPKPTENKGWKNEISPDYERCSPFARATRVMLALDVNKEKLAFLKYGHVVKVDSTEKECQIYRALQDQRVIHIPPFGMGNNAKDQETSTQTWKTKTLPPWVIPAKGPIRLRRSRITLDIIGRSLTNFRFSHQYISAIADAMKAHDSAFFDCEILHCDISVGNIIITGESEGLLVDWDFCIKRDDDTNKKAPITGRSRMGTWQFMSAKLLDHSSTRHTHLDDRESAFYVLLWVALRYTITEAAPGSRYTPKNVLRGFDEVFVDSAGRSIGGDRKKIVLWRYLEEGIVFAERPELGSLMEELALVLNVRYEREPTVEQVADMKKLQAHIEATEVGETIPKSFIDLARYAVVHSSTYIYQQNMSNLGKKGWFVDTIRKYLGVGEWPEDKSSLE